MADKTGISWTDATWNPIAGCSVISPGCTNCYAMAMAARIERMNAGDRAGGLRMRDGKMQEAPLTHYAGLTQPSKSGPVWTGKVAQAPEYTLTQPLRWKKPRRIFVNSMSDLFHESVPDEWIDHIFAVMALAPHTFQVLTKRPKRMREYCSNPKAVRRIYEAVCDIAIKEDVDVLLCAPGIETPLPGPRVYLDTWPLPNVWLGVTAEDQTRADERIPDLLETPAAKRFVSIEPMLGPVDLTNIEINGDAVLDALAPPSWQELWDQFWSPEATGVSLDEAIEGYCDEGGVYPPNDARPPSLDWVIVGGESGPNARPMHPAWPRALRDQCAAAAVPFFFKQHGEWLWTGDDNGEVSFARHELFEFSDGVSLYRVGKRAAGDLLDGVQHHEFPRMP